MLRLVRTLGFILLCGAVAGCGGGAQTQAAKGATDFLTAVHAGDRVAFEKSIDRLAVRDDLRQRMLAVAHENGLDVGGGPSDLTLDRMISPTVFHLVGAADGQPLAQPPTLAQVAPMVKVLDRRQACLTAEGQCLLTFARSSEGWRLTAMPPPEITIVVGAAP